MFCVRWMAHLQAHRPVLLCLHSGCRQLRRPWSSQRIQNQRHQHRRRWQAAALDTGGPGDESIEEARERLSRMMQDEDPMTGTELRELIFRKWGRSYDVRLQRRGTRVYMHVMWKYLEQRSFPLSSEEYQQQLDAIAEYLQSWGVSDVVRTGIASASPRGPGFTGGGSAKAVSIALVEATAAGQGWDL